MARDASRRWQGWAVHQPVVYGDHLTASEAAMQVPGHMPLSPFAVDVVRVLRRLGRPMMVHEIVSATDFHRREVNSALRELAERKRAVEVEGGWYSRDLRFAVHRAVSEAGRATTAEEVARQLQAPLALVQGAIEALCVTGQLRPAAEPAPVSADR